MFSVNGLGETCDWNHGEAVSSVNKTTQLSQNRDLNCWEASVEELESELGFGRETKLHQDEQKGEECSKQMERYVQTPKCVKRLTIQNSSGLLKCGAESHRDKVREAGRMKTLSSVRTVCKFHARK